MDDARESEARNRGERGLVFLVRHGATRANVQGVRLGHMPERLSLLGRRQARELGRRTTGLPLAAIWTSPLLRARQTADIVARERTLPIRVCDELAEMDYGPMEGLYEDEIARRFPEEKRAWSGEPTVAPPGAETLASVIARVVDALERIRRTENALVVTHLTPMRVAWAHYGGHALSEAVSFHPGHAVVHRLEAEGLEPVTRAWSGEQPWR